MRNKKAIISVLALLALILAGTVYFMVMGRAKEDPHPEWDESLVRAGDLLAVKSPEGFEMKDNNDVLSMQGLYYLSWAKGQEEKILNEEEKEATVYDCQIYLLVRECEEEEEALGDVADWMALEEESYQAEKTQLSLVDEITCQAMNLTPKKADNPFEKGFSAFFVRGKLALSAEIFCREGFSEDISGILEEFLNNIQYGE